jgi:hypothetical protein
MDANTDGTDPAGDAETYVTALYSQLATHLRGRREVSLLRRHGQSDSQIADVLTGMLSAGIPPSPIQGPIVFAANGKKPKKAPAAYAIQRAVEETFLDHDLVDLNLERDAAIIHAMLCKHLPQLLHLKRHQANRFIIDAFSNRKKNFVIRTRDGRRYITPEPGMLLALRARRARSEKAAA